MQIYKVRRYFDGLALYWTTSGLDRVKFVFGAVRVWQREREGEGPSGLVAQWPIVLLDNKVSMESAG